VPSGEIEHKPIWENNMKRITKPKGIRIAVIVMLATLLIAAISVPAIGAPVVNGTRISKDRRNTI